MNWGDVAKQVAETGLPLLGGALGGPAGAAVGSLIASALGLSKNTPEELSKALSTNPENIVKLRELEVTERTQLFKLQVDADVALRQADSADLSAVNQSIQAEAKSEHWMQFSWRPFNGFMFGITMFGCYFVLPLAKLPVPIVPFEAWAAWGAVLGVASWYRGKEKLSKIVS